MAARVAIGVVVLLGLVGITAVVVLQDRSSTGAGSRPDFSLDVSSASRSAPQGGTAAWQITASGTGGFRGRVDYAVTGLPVGVTVALGAPASSLSPSAPSAQTRLEVTTTATTPTGDSVVTVVGTSGATRRSVTAALHVTRGPDGSLVVVAGSPLVSDATGPAAAPGSWAGRSFTVSTAAPIPALAPGAPARPVELELSNPDHRPMVVTDLRVAITGTSSAACAASNFAVTQYRGPYPLPVGAGAQRLPLGALGVPADQWPQLTMLDLPTNQDACKGVTLMLTFSGSARNS